MRELKETVMENTNLRIIVIDDNAAIHQDFLKTLGKNEPSNEKKQLTKMEDEFFGNQKQESTLLPKFEIDTASQGQEGVKKIEEALKINRPYALAFVDIRMPPGWDGIETIKHIWKLDDSIQVVICSAYSDYSWEETIKELGKTDNLLILKKPFDNTTVRQLAFSLTKKWYVTQLNQQYTSSLEEKILKRTESLHKSYSLVRATLDSSSEGIIVLDSDKKLLDFNNKFLSLWGISEETIKNNNNFEKITKLISDQIENSDNYLSQIKKIEFPSQDVISGKVLLKNERIYEYYTQPYSLNDEIIGRIWSFRDISKRSLLEQKLKFQATHDPLTELPNRTLLIEFMNQAILTADRNKKAFAVLFLDLDRFKLINDTISHEAGDEVLCIVAKRLQKTIRKNDILARLGGDEFIIIAEEINNQDDIILFAQKIISVFIEPFNVLGNEFTLTTSVGICLYPNDGNSIDLLIRNADKAMYQAKDLGANQYQFYTDDLNKLNLMRLQIENELSQALLKNEFILCYQPQHSLTTGKLLSLEALIRWNHPRRGLLQPADFISIAATTGLIVSIDEWVLRTVCKQIKEWKAQGLPYIRVAVNVTTKQFKAYNFPQLVQNIIESIGIPPECIEFELSEHILINTPDIINSIKDLKKIGVKIALDDFGTGYSALSYLRHLPVDRLKIDQSFVKSIGSSSDDEVIIKAIIAIAQGLKLEIVAEGVETQLQIDFLKSAQCNEVQGFYFNKPLELKECEELLKDIYLKQKP